jgi:Fe-S-cluster-containing dehydrogenase component
MSTTRRDLIRSLAAGGAVAAIGTDAVASERLEPPRDAVGMLYDATRCIGCRACVTACKRANNLPVELYDPPEDLSGTTKNIIKVYESGETRSYVKAQCMHCLDPACTRACMIGALKKRDHGIVTWDGSKCIGCRYCQVACPFQIPKFQWGANNPKIVKCEMCLHLLKGGGQPGCCQACPAQAVIFGPYQELLADAHERIARHGDRYWPQGSPKIYGERDGGGTQVLYLSAVPFSALGLPDLGEEPAGHLAAAVQHGAYKWGIGPVALYGVLAAVVWRSHRSSGAGRD